MKRLIALLLVVFFGWLVIRELWLRDPAADAVEKTVMVEQGSGVSFIAELLKDEDIIESPFLFKVYAKLLRVEGRLQPGAFSLKSGMSTHDVLRRMTDPTATELTLTFPEGWTLAKMGDYLEAEGVTTRAAWDAVATRDLEGYLFPDTYRFLKGVIPEDMVKRLRREMDEKLEELAPALEASGRTTHEILTMASILEQEVRSPEDRRLVADLFWRRLDIGMALQADSTVNYVTGKDTPSISYADRDIDSPYNTYKYRGLPPGPISNPGLDAIRAALEPAANPYFFFLTDAEGKVYYAKTLEEHNVNKARYLR
ncbi:endolytic transglycosylase MltG [Candidatus Uhrbacteria bacterium]|nr:endolytic transglycosylase MltG [Candidatus Uhrbacteria bacterium]